MSLKSDMGIRYYSKNINSDISHIQIRKNNIWNKLSLVLFCLCSSGMRSVDAIYINDHVANGIKK